MRKLHPNIRAVGARRFLATLTIVAGVALLLVHFFQFDHLAAVTLVPPWLMLIPALIVLAVSARAISRTHFVILIALVACFAGLFVEELRSLPRFGRLSEKVSNENQQRLRIVTLNCNAGSAKAAREVLSLSPEIILLQESPGKTTIEELATDFFGESGAGVHGGDASIIVNGTLQPIHVDPASHFVHAVATLHDGRTFDVVSLRLSAPVFRIDFTSAGFWNDHLATRRKHRQQLATVVSHLKTSAVTEHWIVGGDFNLPGNDGATDALLGMQDCFYAAGSGWCNTGTNDYPIFRVDQIWTSMNLNAQRLKAIRSEHSDHRMVAADIEPAR